MQRAFFWLLVFLFPINSVFAHSHGSWESESTLTREVDGKLCYALIPNHSNKKPILTLGRTGSCLSEDENKTPFCAINTVSGVTRAQKFFWLSIRENLDFTNYLLEKKPRAMADKGWAITDIDELSQRISGFLHEEEVTEYKSPELSHYRKVCFRYNQGVMELGRLKITRNNEQKCKLLSRFPVRASDEQHEALPTSWKEVNEYLSHTNFQISRKAALGCGWALTTQEPAQHYPYGVEYLMHYCLYQAKLNQHRYCSYDSSGNYFTGNKVNNTDCDNGHNTLLEDMPKPHEKHSFQNEDL